MSIKKRVLVAVVVIGIIFVFPRIVHAADYDIKSVYYYAFDENENEFLESLELYFFGSFTNEQKAFILFSMLFENPVKGKIRFIPENTQVLYVKIEEETVVVNISDDILAYGGTANENALVRQILKTAASVDDIKYITLLIGYNNACLPEGTFIKNYKLFDEMTEFDNNIAIND